MSSLIEEFAESSRPFEFRDEDFDWLRAKASEHSGIVLPAAKRNMVYSRLSRRLRALGLSDFGAYRKLLSRGDRKEFGEFINALTTNLTAFFREAHHFEHLGQVAIPELLSRRSPGSMLHFWSSACSTGEEPYSLAMTLAECAERQALPYEILATDLDTKVLAHASAGIYTNDRLEPIREQLRKKYLWRGAGESAGYFRVRDELRSRVRFSQLNLTDHWQHRAPCDVIFCRNVVIYFDKALQRRLFDRMADQMTPGGYLYVGHAETLFQITDRFELCGKTVYRRIE